MNKFILIPIFFGTMLISMFLFLFIGERISDFFGFRRERKDWEKREKELDKNWEKRFSERRFEGEKR